jgi:glycosyltransferase involved in cell wall biosynthesis
MSAPLVSIVIPVYNGSDFLREAIDSALAQTYINKEIIVVNDGSKDEDRTREIALSYGSKIRYFEKENGGVATALNMGIETAKGKYISWLSHDDAYFPDKLEKQVPVLEKLESEGRKSVAYSSFVFMDDRSIVYSKMDMPEVTPSRFYSALLCNRVFISSFKIMTFGLHGCTLLIPKTAFEEIGLFNVKLPTTQDYELWFKMLGVYDFVNVNGHLVKSRIHKWQGTHVLRKERVEEVEDLYLKAFRLYRSGDERYDLDLPQTVLALKLTRRMRAYAAAREELRKDKFSLRSWSYVFRSVLASKSLIKARLTVRYGITKAKKTLIRTS